MSEYRESSPCLFERKIAIGSSANDTGTQQPVLASSGRCAGGLCLRTSRISSAWTLDGSESAVQWPTQSWRSMNCGCISSSSLSRFKMDANETLRGIRRQGRLAGWSLGVESGLMDGVGSPLSWRIWLRGLLCLRRRTAVRFSRMKSSSPRRRCDVWPATMNGFGRTCWSLSSARCSTERRSSDVAETTHRRTLGRGSASERRVNRLKVWVMSIDSHGFPLARAAVKFTVIAPTASFVLLRRSSKRTSPSSAFTDLDSLSMEIHNSAKHGSPRWLSLSALAGSTAQWLSATRKKMKQWMVSLEAKGLLQNTSSAREEWIAALPKKRDLFQLESFVLQVSRSFQSDQARVTFTRLVRAGWLTCCWFREAFQGIAVQNVRTRIVGKSCGICPSGRVGHVLAVDGVHANFSTGDARPSWRSLRRRWIRNGKTGQSRSGCTRR